MHARCVCVLAWTQTCLNIKTSAPACVRRKNPPLPRTKLQKLATTGLGADLLFHQLLSSISSSPRIRPPPPKQQPELYFTGRKQILSARLCCFTSATVYLPVSRSFLFLHVPDIIIAVRGMIICLLWKLADCLSPVPEELPLKGVPLEKHHKSGFSSAQTHKGADRTTQGRKGRYSKRRRERERERVAGPLCYNIYLYRSIHHTSFSASSLEQAG